MELSKPVLKKIIKSLGEAVIVTDQDNQLLLMNRVAEDIFGIREGDALGKNLLLQIEDSVFAAKWIEFLLRDVDILNQEMKISYPVYRVLSATHARFKDEKGRRLGSVTIFRDVSSEKEIERRQKDFVSEVSHEFRSALASINGFIGTLSRCPEMPLLERQKCLKLVSDEAHRINSLVENLLDLSKIEAGKISLKLELTSLDKLVNDSVFVLKHQFDQKGVKLETIIARADYETMLDMEMFIQVIHNLLVNSLKFTPAGGRVTVSLSRKKDDIILRVSDTGIGISEKDLPHIFEKFYCVFRGETISEGTGLGLPIVKEMVGLHQGKIEVQSQEEQGTTFTVLLPVKRD